MNTVEDLIARWQSAREEMMSCLEEIDRNRKIYPLWTVREVLAHISGWDDAIEETVRSFLTGQMVQISPAAARGADVYNAETVHTREGLDYDHIYREFVGSRERVIALLKQFPPEKVEMVMPFTWGESGTLAALLGIFIAHEHEHAADMRKLIEEHA